MKTVHFEGPGAPLGLVGSEHRCAYAANLCALFFEDKIAEAMAAHVFLGQNRSV
jgi:hypothetical protein